MDDSWLGWVDAVLLRALCVLAWLSPRFEFGIVQRRHSSKGKDTHLPLRPLPGKETHGESQSQNKSAENSGKNDPDVLLHHGVDDQGDGNRECSSYGRSSKLKSNM